MIPYPAHVEIDLSKFAPGLPEEQLEARYGLPRQVRFCRKCVMSNQKPNSCHEFEHTAHSVKKSMHIAEDGVCDACVACADKVGKIDWQDRERQLRELCRRYRRSDGGYDCLVPGSGGKDSFYAAHLLKYKYGMHPLTVTWAPHLYTPWGWRNFQAWVHAGFDNYLCTPNGRTHRLLTRLATENLFHPFQPFILGQKQLAPKMAAKFGIPLVFYGENEAEFGNPLADNESALRDERFFATNDRDHIYLGGVSLQQLEEEFKMCIRDSIYTIFSYAGPFIPIGTLPGMAQRTVTVRSFSKDYCMTGWRIGYVIAPPQIIEALQLVGESNVYSAPSISQRAGIAAFRLRREVQPAIVEEFRRRTEAACAAIGEFDYLSVLPPQGSIYLFVNIKRTGLTSHEFAAQLLERYHILVVPGNAFGTSGEGYVRLALTLGVDRIQEAFARLPKDRF